MIYLDNAATTYPKPRLAANTVATTKIGTNPGRSGHNMSIAVATESINGRPFE